MLNGVSHLIPHRCQIGFQMEDHFIWNGASHLIPICVEMVSKWENKCYLIWNELFHLVSIGLELVSKWNNRYTYGYTITSWIACPIWWNGITPFPLGGVSHFIPMAVKMVLNGGKLSFNLKWCFPFYPNSFGIGF